MCGLTGYWDFKNKTLDDHIIQTMTHTLTHRGPDSHGFWSSKETGIFLGHRRLAIIDLSPAGHQPMLSHCQRYILAYNGEVYNSNDLKKQLEKSNVTFKGNSDTEVILAAISQWGLESALQQFIGMFAFALYDIMEQRLHLVRDRLGIKPLYWGFHNNILFFGSELKSFCPHPKWHPNLNHKALDAFFQFNYIPAPLSIFQGIEKLLPGTYVSININKEVKKSIYWRLDDHISQKNHLSIEENLSNLHQIIQQSVQQRMISDVPIGAFLSGGIDSSLVASLMQASASKPIKTFTIGFQEKSFNEAIYAKKIAQHLGTDHHELYLTEQDALNIIPNLSQWYDEPFADSSQIPTYLVSKLARREVTVTLSGDGGDESFTGYNRYLFTNRLWQLLKITPDFILKLIQNSLDFSLKKQWDKFLRYIPYLNKIPNLHHKLHTLSKVLTHREIKSLYKQIINVWNSDLITINKENRYLAPWQEKFLLSSMEQLQFWDTLCYLPDDILTKVDRASMAVSLEVRVPLLDHRVVETAWQLPNSMKLKRDKTKWALRQLLSQYIPNHLIERPKMGFGVPIGEWLRKDLKEWGQDLLLDLKNDHQNLFDHALITRLYNNHMTQQGNHPYQLWGLLMFQSWYQTIQKQKKE